MFVVKFFLIQEMKIIFLAVAISASFNSVFFKELSNGQSVDTRNRLITMILRKFL